VTSLLIFLKNNIHKTEKGHETI